MTEYLEQNRNMQMYASQHIHFQFVFYISIEHAGSR